MTHWLDKVVLLFQADTSDLRELARIAGADPSVFYRGIDITKLDLNGQDLDGIEFSTPLDARGTQLVLDLFQPDSKAHILDRIKSAPRQEERAVLFLAEFLRDRLRAMQVIDEYSHDKALLTNSVLNALREIRSEEIFGRRFSNLQIARKVSGRFARSEDKRSVLAYFLAKYLGTYPELRAWIENKSVEKLSKQAQEEFKRFLREPAVTED
ncbi:MAG: hypothetical protein QOJ84_3186 [Bradyrhizobium sp.]|nr:hypothetical protein [Bradyrhizobium sp.]